MEEKVRERKSIGNQGFIIWEVKGKRTQDKARRQSYSYSHKTT